MNLLSIQRDMARAVMMPLTPSERMRNAGPDGQSQRKVANAIIKPNDRLTSFERLEIYNRQSKRTLAIPLLKRMPLFLAVHRMDEDVYFRRLERKEFAILCGLRNGKSPRAAIECVLRNSALADEESLMLVQKWFQNWSALGWFYSEMSKFT